MRDDEANENEQITEFQQELVQMAAALCGDCAKDSYPDKLVQQMKVCDAVDYVDKAFKKFCEDCKQKNNQQTDEASSSNNKNNVDADAGADTEVLVPDQQNPKASTSFFRKMVSCLVCNK